MQKSTTRSGRTYRKESASENSAMTDQGNMSELVKILLEDRKKWEAESAKREADLIAERARQERERAEERDRREADHSKQMERLCEQMEIMRKFADKGSAGSGVREETVDVLKLTKLTGSKDIEGSSQTTNSKKNCLSILDLCYVCT